MKFIYADAIDQIDPGYDFERDRFTLMQASETLPRLLHRDLQESFGQPVETVLDTVVGTRVRALPDGAAARRRLALLRRLFAIRTLSL